MGKTGPGYMAVAAGKVEADLTADQVAFCVEGVDLCGVDGHQVCADITGELVDIAPGALDHIGHMAFDTG